MSEFVTKKLEEIKGSKFNFFKLVINGKCYFSDFENEIRSNKRYYSEFKTLLTYAELYANGAKLPSKKHNTVHINVKDVSAFEFKSKHLRIYFFYSIDNPDRIIAFCGYKNRQKKDINSFKSIVLRFLTQLQ